jgi:predicted MFS family arabinose efflux permease
VPFMSLYLTRKLGFSALQAGSVLALYGVGSIAGSYLGGWLSDRLGPVRIQLASLTATGAGFLGLAVVKGHGGVGFAVLAVSVVAEAYRPALFTSVALAAPPAVRTRSFSLLRLAVNLGMSVGPAVGGLLAVKHYGLLFVADAATCWAAAGVLYATLGAAAPVASHSSRREGRGRSPWRDGPYVTFLALVAVLATAFLQVMSTLPLYLRQRYGLPEDKIGFLLGLNAMIITVVEMVLMRTVERFHPVRVLALGSLLVCLGLAMTGIGATAGFAVLTIVVWTVGEMLSLPLANSVAAQRAEAGSAGRYLGAYTLAFSSAFVAAPMIGTAVYERIGPRALWGGVGAMGIVLCGAFALLATNLGGQRLAGTHESGQRAGGGPA